MFARPACTGILFLAYAAAATNPFLAGNGNRRVATKTISAGAMMGPGNFSLTARVAPDRNATADSLLPPHQHNWLLRRRCRK